jgi:hypothetical protein
MADAQLGSPRVFAKIGFQEVEEGPFREKMGMKPHIHI